MESRDRLRRSFDHFSPLLDVSFLKIAPEWTIMEEDRNFPRPF